MTGNHRTGPDHARKVITQKYPINLAKILVALYFHSGMKRFPNTSSNINPINCVAKNCIAPDLAAGTALPISDGTWIKPDSEKAMRIFKYLESSE